MVFESDNEEEGFMRFKGPLTIQQAADFRDALAESVGASERIELDLTGVEEVDVAGLQLICSALLTCSGMNKTLVVRDGASGACVRAIEAAGLSYYLAGSLETD